MAMRCKEKGCNFVDQGTQQLSTHGAMLTPSGGYLHRYDKMHAHMGVHAANDKLAAIPSRNHNLMLGSNTARR